MAGRIDARLAELGIELPEAPAPVASYVPYTVSGKLVFLSGQINVWNGEFGPSGKVGVDVTIEQGQEAAGELLAVLTADMLPVERGEARDLTAAWSPRR